MKTKSYKTQKTPALTEAMIITSIGIVVIYGLDYLVVEATISPVVCICFLFMLALRYPPRIVAVCMLFLWAFVSFVLWRFTDYSATPNGMAKFFTRVLTFGAAGGIALAAASYRARLDHVIQQLLSVLEAIPIPLLICDSRGFIISASNETFTFSSLPKDALIGFRLSEVVGTHLLEEAEENWYDHWMQSPEGNIFDAELQLGAKRRSAKVGRIGVGKHAIMIVIFI